MSVSRLIVLAPALLLLTACAGPLSTFNTAGRGAEAISRIFWWMAAGAGIIWIAVVILALYCARGHRVPEAQRFAPLLIVGGGVVLPSVVLTALLAFGLPSLQPLIDLDRTSRLSIAVAGEQWWWRVRYISLSGDTVDLANEIRLPVGERVDVQLSSGNVIHSFWIPAIAGKVDMIPGRTTHLSLEPTRTGVFRGTCAEYCGTSHAMMAFPVAVLAREVFDAWLAEQSKPAQEPVTVQAARGRDLFAANGCSACHTIRGTSAAGVIGPDLTHVGSRMSLAAATLPNETAHMVDWITEPERAKPGVHMPAFGVLGSDQLHALAAYLSGLR